MKIVSKSKCNIGVYLNGKRIIVPAAPSVLELDDNHYEGFDKAIAPFIAKGKMKFLKKPVVSPEQQAKDDKVLEADLREQMKNLEARRAIAEK